MGTKNRACLIVVFNHPPPNGVPQRGRGGCEADGVVTHKHEKIKYSQNI